MLWQLKLFSQLSNQELFEIYKARVEVFVVEQNCAYQEVDDNDLIALHLFAKNSQKLTAYCRIIPKEKGVAIGRVLVAKANRGTGLARELMQKALEICQQHWQHQPIYVQAQAHLEWVLSIFRISTYIGNLSRRWHTAFGYGVIQLDNLVKSGRIFRDFYKFFEKNRLLVENWLVLIFDESCNFN